MLRVIHSIPESCPTCDSEDLELYEAGGTLICHGCGEMSVLREDEIEDKGKFEVSASFITCPHCKFVGHLQVTGGEEWCSDCALNPNKTYPSEELAFLWKEGSDIKKVMDKGIPHLGIPMHRFVTTVCGPHCAFGENCPQTLGNFRKCYSEEREDDPDLLHIEGINMGRGSKKRKRKEKKLQKEIIRKIQERAVFMCAKSGWYNKRYCNETINSQEHTDTGS